jgi:hypothetical protein
MSKADQFRQAVQTRGAGRRGRWERTGAMHGSPPPPSATRWSAAFVEAIR